MATISKIRLPDETEESGYKTYSLGGGGGGSASITNKNFTLLASGWSNGIYSIESIYPAAEYTILNVFMQTSITEEQRDALLEANIYGVETEENRLVAHGTVPTIDIPVVFQFLGTVE